MKDFIKATVEANVQQKAIYLYICVVYPAVKCGNTQWVLDTLLLPFKRIYRLL
jgi:hypothetical protein